MSRYCEKPKINKKRPSFLKDIKIFRPFCYSFSSVEMGIGFALIKAEKSDIRAFEDLPTWSQGLLKKVLSKSCFNLGGSPSLVVMEGGSCAEGHRFES